MSISYTNQTRTLAARSFRSVSFKSVDLVRRAGEMTRRWHPNMQQLIRLTDPATAAWINIRTSVPIPPQMNADDLLHKPVLGRVQLALMRGGMRVVNAFPFPKRRITESIIRTRGAN